MLYIGVLCVFAAIFCLVLGLAWRPETPLAARMAMLRGERPALDYRAVTRRESIGVRVIGPLADSLGGNLEHLLPSRWGQAIQQSLLEAGQPVTLTGFLIGAFITEAAVLGIGFVLVSTGGLAPSQALMGLGGLAVLGLYLPKIWLSNRVRHRQKAILLSLPDAFDLITVCVEAGLGLDAALARVAEKIEGPFGEELAICLKEVSLGKLRRVALRELADRTGVPDFTTFINAVIQAESMGTSIAAVLRVQAEQMRMRRRQRAEQQAQAAPIKMMFPLVFCIFPTLFIVILGPAAISLYEQLVREMIVKNANRGSVLGEAIEVASSAVQRVKGLLGRECLEDGQGLLFRHCASLHTFFMRFPIDIVFADKRGKVLKASSDVHPFKLVAAPFRAHYALELPVGSIRKSKTRVGDHIDFLAEAVVVQETEPLLSSSEASG